MKIVKERLNLANEIPLARPWAVMFELSSLCNFACEFCPVSKKEDRDKHGLKLMNMQPELFKKMIDQLKEFPDTGQPFKFYYNGGGESLMNSNFVEMIEYAISNFPNANAHIIRTNASLITPEVSDKLIKAGMTEINISIEAVNEEGYEKITHRKGMFQRVLDNVTYLYDHRGNCRIYAKIIPLGTPETDETEFFRIFTPITDIRETEHIMHWANQTNELVDKLRRPEITVNGDPITDNIACPYIFYTLMLTAFGQAHLCCFDLFNYVDVGNVNDNTLLEIWTGEKIKDFWRMHLEGRRFEHKACSDCFYTYGAPDFLTEQDRLDILERLK